MRTLMIALLTLPLVQPTVTLADGRSPGVYRPSGTIVVGGGYGYGPRGYRGRGWGYRGPGVGVYLGAPMYWGWPWGPPAYYPPPIMYPPVVTVPPPVVYVERGETAAPSASTAEQVLEPGYWYYCRELAAYYPAVMQCPGLWFKVAPRSD